MVYKHYDSCDKPTQDNTDPNDPWVKVYPEAPEGNDKMQPYYMKQSVIDYLNSPELEEEMKNAKGVPIEQFLKELGIDDDEE